MSHIDREDTSVYRVVRANGDKASLPFRGGVLFDNLAGAKRGRDHFDKSSVHAPHRVQYLEIDLVCSDVGWVDVDPADLEE